MSDLRTREIRDGGCLWPAPFNEPTAEAAWEFVKICRTWNESERQVQPFPDKRYLQELTRERCECRATGIPLIIEKSRRLVTSWLFRALELHDLGLSRGKGIITHLRNEDAAGHVWRIWHLYNDLRKQFPEWKMPEPKTYGRLADEQLESLVLPNDSRVQKHYEQPTGMQGSGFSWVTAEELSLYRRPSALFSQAQFVTQASAGAVPGLIVVITNSSPSEDWQLLKGKQPQGSLVA